MNTIIDFVCWFAGRFLICTGAIGGAWIIIAENCTGMNPSIPWEHAGALACLLIAVRCNLGDGSCRKP